MRTPGDKFRNCEGVDIVHKLLNNQIIRDAKICGGKTPLREGKINAVHTKHNFVFQFTQIGLLQAGAITYDKSALAFVNILHFCKASNALATPGMQIRGRELRDTPDSIVEG